METVLSICLGIGLSAACGFRVFVPMLGLSIASLAGHVTLTEGFDWIGTWPALICFATATAAEIAAYYVPWIDNLLDSLATPTAVVAGTIAMAAVVSDMSPMMRWSLAIIAGGGSAGIVQAGTVATRGASTFSTAGLANFGIATGELALSSVLTILAIVLPLLVAVLALGLVATAVVYWLRRRMQLTQTS